MEKTKTKTKPNGKVKSRFNPVAEEGMKCLATIQDFVRQNQSQLHRLGAFAVQQLPRAELFKLLQIENLPLGGLDLIPTSQGMRLYINQEGAKAKLANFIDEKNLTVIDEEPEILELPENTNNGRCTIKYKTVMRDNAAFEKVLAIAPQVKPEVLDKLLAGVFIEYKTLASHSYELEGNPANRKPSAIIMKCETKGKRRCYLKAAKSTLLKSDEEEIIADAPYTVKASVPSAPELKVPEPLKPVERPQADPAPATTTPTTATITEARVREKFETPQGDIKSLLRELDLIFNEQGMSGAQRLFWLKEHFGVLSYSKLTVEIARKAIETLKGNPPKSPPVSTSADDAQKADEARRARKAELIRTIFGKAKSLGYPHEDAGQMALDMKSKRLEDMDPDELADVLKFWQEMESWQRREGGDPN